MKNLNIIIIVLCVFAFAACKETAAEQTPSEAQSNTEKPYQATTPDKCVHEKECVWWHYKNAVLGALKNHSRVVRASTGRSDKYRKSKSSVKISYLGDYNDGYLDHISNLINQLFPYHNIKYIPVKNGANHLLIFDYDYEIYMKNLINILVNYFSREEIVESFERLQNEGNGCFDISLADDRSRYEGVFSFISPKLKEPRECMGYLMYLALGLDVYDIPERFPLFNDKANYSEYSDIYKFLVYIHYSSKIAEIAAIPMGEKMFYANFEAFHSNFTELRRKSSPISVKQQTLE